MVHRVAELLHIESKLQNRATRLSGGEMQRVAIGRALVRAPAIYLMDEPLSSLDAKLRAELRLELKRIQSELGATILYVTHDQIEAMTMASRIGVICPKAALVQIGTPREVYERPANTYVAAHLGTPVDQPHPAPSSAGDARCACRHAHHWRAHRASADRARAQWCRRKASLQAGRASRRPEPPASGSRRAQPGYARRSARALERGRHAVDRAGRPDLFRRRRASGSSLAAA